MSLLTRPISTNFKFARVSPIAVLMGAAILAAPLATARAESVKTHPIPMMQVAAADVPAVAPAMPSKPQTVEARIADLHAKLAITAEQEAKWNDVAKVMRANDARMQKLVAEKKAQFPKGMTAVDDLMTYQKFAEAHVAGLKNLTAAFKTLYGAMPADQKRIADQTFMHHDRVTVPAHG